MCTPRNFHSDVPQNVRAVVQTKWTQGRALGTGRREKGRKDLRTRLRNRRMKNRTPSILVQTPSILVIFGKLMIMVCVGLFVNGLMFSPICTPFPFPRNVYVRTYLCLSVSLSLCPRLQRVCLHAWVQEWYVCASMFLRTCPLESECTRTVVRACTCV